MVSLGGGVYSVEIARFVSMIIIPAIDLKDGRCVRLAQGDFERVTVYADDPVAMACHWQGQGAERIHLVDLDGSLAGSPQNGDYIREIVRTVSVPVQVGGGIRNQATIESYLAMGVRWVILGTAALRDAPFVRAVCRAYEGRIILGIDAADGQVAVQGWTEGTSTSPSELASRYEQEGLAAIIYTDIRRDGMGSGINIEGTKALAQAVAIPVIASGGVAGLEDIARLKEIEACGVVGVVIGKALYAGTLSLKEALSAAAG
ncbi:MAG: 1-(5-phosphoribosyl)-5-[(5-phosphoribosylamino)methylideneamino]imidazole-4-carboxamide isomerase [Syntrophales bacterium]